MYWLGKRSDNVRILIIGAGVLGSNLAHSMRKGNDITILARGRTYQNLKNGGLVIKHKLGKKTTDCFTVIDKLQTDDIYDAIFVVSRFSSLDSIVPMIKCNKSKNIVFVGNNMTVEKYENLENKNVLFAFFSAAGKKYDGYINSICLNKIEIGRTDGKDYSDKFITSIFAGTKIKVTIDNKMNDNSIIVPLKTVQMDSQGNYVFLVKKISGKYVLNKKYVTTGEVSDDGIKINKGLEKEDIILAAGIRFAIEGEQVNIVEDKEE